ncbi:AmmeMemoRadiSam system protein B [Aliikangiella marina]|uniref:MEMO1 family protein FLL45_01750 n=1 Tax=Aliikangiella marina TaxID=1712262 RepID=A0A545THN0_9GAMM|nr:AmmeMemoRadiSam system protein B [Aliikangiella marina]TQV76708.1 AmmeMemoRadiSam system protein B [Aliikangiella marina]
MDRVRPPAVAGSFYPGDQVNLSHLVDDLISHSESHFSYNARGFIVPHAGYQYSGSTAAEAYALIAKQKAEIKRVVLLGPCHREWIAGIAVPSCDKFSSPLGDIPLDIEAINLLAKLPQVSVSDKAHKEEHSLEVQLPFLQRALDEFQLIPLAVGDATPEEVAEVIETLWKLENTIVVVSSDLSHFLSYDDANIIDHLTTRKILDKNYQALDHHMACGCTPIQGLLEVASEKSLNVSLLKQCNSGDTAGDKSRVVGYAAYAIY